MRVKQYTWILYSRRENMRAYVCLLPPACHLRFSPAAPSDSFSFSFHSIVEEKKRSDSVAERGWGDVHQYPWGAVEQQDCSISQLAWRGGREATLKKSVCFILLSLSLSLSIYDVVVVPGGGGELQGGSIFAHVVLYSSCMASRKLTVICVRGKQGR